MHSDGTRLRQEGHLLVRKRVATADAHRVQLQTSYAVTVFQYKHPAEKATLLESQRHVR